MGGQERGTGNPFEFAPQHADSVESRGNPFEFAPLDGSDYAERASPSADEGAGPVVVVDRYQIDTPTKPDKEDLHYHKRMLVLAKAVYFCVFAADASWEPFAAYVLSQRGMNNAVIGSLLTAMTVCNAVSGQLLTAFADRYMIHRNVALTSFTLFVILTCSLVFSNNFAFTAVVGISVQQQVAI